MTVIEAVRFYHLELMDKVYNDVCGRIWNFPNLKKLCDLPVKSINIDLVKDEVRLTVIGIENIAED